MNIDLLWLAGFLAVSCPVALIAGGVAEWRDRNRVGDEAPMPDRVPEPQPAVVTVASQRLDLPEAA